MDVLDQQQQKSVYAWTKAGTEVKGFGRRFLSHLNTTYIITPCLYFLSLP